MNPPATILKYILYFCFLFTVFSCKKEYTSHSSPTDIEYWMKMAEDSLLSNITASKDALSKVMELADNKNHEKEVNLLRATIFFYESKMDSATTLLNELEMKCKLEKQFPHSIWARLHAVKGKIYMHKYQPDSAIISFKEAYRYLIVNDNPEQLPNLTINLADAYNMNGNYAECAYYYRKALHQIDSLGLPETRKPTIYSGLGHTYMELRNFELSDYFYDMAAEYFDEMNFIEKYFYLNNRGSQCYFKKDYENSLHYFLKAKELAFSQPQREHQKQLITLNLAEVYLFQEERDSTRKYLALCEPYFRKIQNATAIYYIETLKIGLAIQEKDWKTAERLIAESFTPGYIYPNILNLRQSQLKLYYEQTGNFRKAYEALTIEKQLEDSIRNESVKKNVAEIEFRYQQDTILINQRHLLHEKENEARVWKHGLVSILLFCTLLIIGMILYTKKQKEYTRIKNRYQMVNLKMESIRNRISPHFIFNTLNRILHTPEDADNRINRLEKLIHLIRKNLEIVNQSIVTLDEEISFIENYFAIEKETLGEDVIFDLKISPDIDQTQFWIPSMIIQIPVENAIKHGLRGREGVKELHLHIYKEKNVNIIKVWDNGPGYHISSQPNLNNTGNGLRILSQTIYTMNMQNKEKMQLHISNIYTNKDIAGCQVIITIPENYKYPLS